METLKFIGFVAYILGGIVAFGFAVEASPLLAVGVIVVWCSIAAAAKL